MTLGSAALHVAFVFERRLAEAVAVPVAEAVARAPYVMILVLAGVPATVGGVVAFRGQPGIGLGLAGAGALLVLIIVPSWLWRRAMARRHAAERAKMQAELDALLQPRSEPGPATERKA